jgi:hypothetical protein
MKRHAFLTMMVVMGLGLLLRLLVAGSPPFADFPCRAGSHHALRAHGGLPVAVAGMRGSTPLRVDMGGCASDGCP